MKIFDIDFKTIFSYISSSSLALQVMSPCLIPQPNGAPPLIVNMPSYVYPNMANMAQTTAGLIGKVDDALLNWMFF